MEHVLCTLDMNIKSFLGLHRSSLPRASITLRLYTWWRSRGAMAQAMFGLGFVESVTMSHLDLRFGHRRLETATPLVKTRWDPMGHSAELQQLTDCRNLQNEVHQARDTTTAPTEIILETLSSDETGTVDGAWHSLKAFLKSTLTQHSSSLSL